VPLTDGGKVEIGGQPIDSIVGNSKGRGLSFNCEGNWGIAETDGSAPKRSFGCHGFRHVPFTGSGGKKRSLRMRLFTRVLRKKKQGFQVDQDPGRLLH
jgi:hypothetical protein